MALLPLQLVCYMRSYASASEPSMLEVFAKAVCAFAEGVAEVVGSCRYVCKRVIPYLVFWGGGFL